MKFSRNHGTSSTMKVDGRDVTRTNTTTVELDFLTLAGIIILGIIAYELSMRGIAIPMFIWYLVGVLLFIYIMLLSVSTILLIFLWKERDN